MTAPTPDARRLLDNFIQSLAKHGDGLTLEDFRGANIAQAKKTATAVRRLLYTSGTLFMAALIADLFGHKYFRPDDSLTWVGIWAIALGGLGAIASIFLHVLKILPQETLKTTDEVEVVGRIFLGCLFSLVLCVTLTAEDMTKFFAKLGDASNKESVNSIKLMLPFLCGYSIQLVLGLLGKMIRAVELTIGLDDRREASNTKLSRSK